MPYNNLATHDDRSDLRCAAWKDSCCDLSMWLALLLAATSTTLSLVRDQTPTDDPNYNTLFGLEFGALILSLLLDYWANVQKIENLRILHAINKQARFTDEKAALIDNEAELARLTLQNYPDGYKVENGANSYETNGLTKGISGPTNIGLIAGIALGTASVITFFAKQNRASTVFGAIAPIASTYINSFTRARYEREEAALEQITHTTAEEHNEERADCAMLGRILSCGKRF